MKISTNPIQIPIKPRKSFLKADWTKYKNILSNHSLHLINGDTLEDTDDCINKLTEAIQQADKEAIQTITNRTLPHPNREKE